jgi:hypothetical protein
MGNAGLCDAIIAPLEWSGRVHQQKRSMLREEERQITIAVCKDGLCAGQQRGRSLSCLDVASSNEHPPSILRETA